MPRTCQDQGLRARADLRADRRQLTVEMGRAVIGNLRFGRISFLRASPPPAFFRLPRSGYSPGFDFSSYN